MSHGVVLLIDSVVRSMWVIFRPHGRKFAVLEHGYSTV